MTKDLVILLLLASVSLKAGAVLPSDFYQTEAGKVFSALLKNDRKNFDSGNKTVFKWSKDINENTLMSNALSGRKSVEIYAIYSVINNHPDTFSFENFRQKKTSKMDMLKNFSNKFAEDVSAICGRYFKDSKAFSMPSISSTECDARVSNLQQRVEAASEIKSAQR